jgi:hypothetical protein
MEQKVGFERGTFDPFVRLPTTTTRTNAESTRAMNSGDEFFFFFPSF